jgi:hypothetical protein
VAPASRRPGHLRLAPPAGGAGGDLSARLYLSLIFLANAGGFFLLGWALECRDEPPLDWGRIVGVALLMGIVTADLAARLAEVEAGEVRTGFRGYWRGTRWMLVLWGSLIAALGGSFLLVSALGH